MVKGGSKLLCTCMYFEEIELNHNTLLEISSPPTISVMSSAMLLTTCTPWELERLSVLVPMPSPLGAVNEKCNVLVVSTVLPLNFLAHCISHPTPLQLFQSGILERALSSSSSSLPVCCLFFLMHLQFAPWHTYCLQWWCFQHLACGYAIDFLVSNS